MRGRIAITERSVALRNFAELDGAPEAGTWPNDANPADGSRSTPSSTPRSGASGSSVPFRVGDRSAAGLHQLVRLDAGHVAPRTCRRPHLGPLQQGRVDEHPQVRLLAEGRHATVDCGNPSNWVKSDAAMEWWVTFPIPIR